MVSYDKRMRVLVRKGINATPQLDNFLCLRPFTQLSLCLMARYITRQK